MNDENNAWFHCGRCGKLFQSVLEVAPGERPCANCGANPSIGVQKRLSASTRAMAVFAKPEMLAGPVDLPVRRESSGGEDRRKREKTNRLATKLVVAWLVVLISSVVLVKMYSSNADESQAQESRVTANLVSQDQGFIDDAAPEFVATLGGFLRARTPEGKNQFVHAPLDQIGPMDRFYRSNPMADLEWGKLRYVRPGQVLRQNGRKAISTRWQHDDQIIDAVFYHEKGEWRLDWEQFVRYSDMPWQIFLADSGSDTGEFRLLARQRSTREDESGSSATAGAKKKMVIVFYAPQFGKPGEVAESSPEFVVDAESTAGRRLKAGFEKKKDEASFGALENPDPDGMIRVRVRVSRLSENRVRSFELEEVLATNWLSEDFSDFED